MEFADMRMAQKIILFLKSWRRRLDAMTFFYSKGQTEETNYANQKKSLWNFCIWSSPILCDQKTLKLDERETKKSSRILLLNIFVLMKFKIKRNE